MNPKALSRRMTKITIMIMRSMRATTLAEHYVHLSIMENEADIRASKKWFISLMAIVFREISEPQIGGVI